MAESIPTPDDRSAYTMRQTAAYHALRVEGVSDGARLNGWKLTLRDVIALDSARAFLDRVARDDFDVFEPEPEPSDPAPERHGEDVDDYSMCICGRPMDGHPESSDPAP